nr:hypothetical protein [Tanacetum cinerariifolium]GEY01652.1 hypothetical protein [Tanacetum cinerariifolium]
MTMMTLKNTSVLPLVEESIQVVKALQKEAAAASIVAEDFARRFQSREAVVNVNLPCVILRSCDLKKITVDDTSCDLKKITVDSQKICNGSAHEVLGVSFDLATMSRASGRRIGRSYGLRQQQTGWRSGDPNISFRAFRANFLFTCEDWFMPRACQSKGPFMSISSGVDSSEVRNVTPPDGAWTEYVSGGVTLLSISSTKHKERPLKVSDQRSPN